VRAVEAARKALEPLLLATRPAPAEVALTWSDPGRAMVQTEPLGANRTHEVDYNRTLAGWHRLLLDLGLHRELRFEGASLGGLKLLITPMMPHASGAFLKKVESFVRAGGVWLCAPVTGTRTAEHTVPTDAGLGGVEPLAGVEAVFSFPVTDTGGEGEAFGCTAKLGGWCSALKPASSDTRAIGGLKSGLAPGLAFVTERKLGEGLVVAIAAQPLGAEGEKLLARLVNHYAAKAKVAARFEVTPGTIVCPRIGDDGKKVWVLVNMDGKGGEMTLPADAKDALSGERLAGGGLKLRRYEWRAIRWP
jgi:beta-galactosidase